MSDLLVIPVSCSLRKNERWVTRNVWYLIGWPVATCGVGESMSDVLVISVSCSLTKNEICPGVTK